MSEGLGAQALTTLDGRPMAPRIPIRLSGKQDLGHVQHQARQEVYGASQPTEQLDKSRAHPSSWVGTQKGAGSCTELPGPLLPVWLPSFRPYQPPQWQTDCLRLNVELRLSFYLQLAFNSS